MGATRRRSLSNSDILRRFARFIDNPERFLKFARTLGQGSSNDERELVANDTVQQIRPLVRRVFGDSAILTLHGSRAKWTHLEDSDFDYHIEGLGRDITLQNMYDLKDEIDSTMKDAVITHREIKLALLVMASEDYSLPFTIEIVPEQCDYLDAEALVTIEKATPYFRMHESARNVVRALKYLFLRTRPKLKNCELEGVVEDLHRSLVGNGLPSQEPETSHGLFVHALRRIQDQAHNLELPQMQRDRYCNMAKLVDKFCHAAAPERRHRVAFPERPQLPDPPRECASGETKMPKVEEILACLRTALESGRGPLSVREVYFLSLGRDPTKEQMGADVKAEMNRKLTSLKSQNAVTSVNGLWSLQSSAPHSSAEASMPDGEQILACLRAAARSGQESLSVREVYLMSLGRDPKREQMGSGVRTKVERILKALQTQGSVTRVSGPKEWSRWSLQT